MFQETPSKAALRRRAVALVDVVMERHSNGPLRLAGLISAAAVSVVAVLIVYWYYILPLLRDLDTRSWYWKRQPSTHGVRAGGPWSDVHWGKPAVLTVAYLLTVFVGRHAMERRAPVQKHVFEYKLVYNLTQVVINASLGVALFREAWVRRQRTGFPYPWGNELEFGEEGHYLGMLIWFQYQCRMLELFDTVFILLRKKYHHMLFLHIFLRLIHMWGWFVACRYACGGDSVFPAVINCFCQVVVYLYYALSLVSHQGAPLMRKARVTEVQIVQFIICGTHAMYCLVHGHLPRLVPFVSLAVMMSGLFMYVEWRDHQLHVGPRSNFDPMFGHMFSEQSITDARRRALTLIDAIGERDGPLRPHRLLAAFGVSLVYWWGVLPAVRDFGTGLWYTRAEEVHFARAGGPWAELSWLICLAMTVVYLFGVRVGIRVMERRPPVQERIFEFMFIYNVTLVMLNASLSFTLWKEAWDLGFPYPWGNALDYSERGHRLGMLLWFEYHGRQLELLDTLFVILRKKFYRMSSLHIALRLSHMWGWFFCCRYACGGDSYFPAAVNCTCQVLVYSYYSLSLLDSRGIPPVLLKRARVTEVQISRLMICSAHALYVLIQGNLPRPIAAVSLCVMGCSLLLYVDFDGQRSEDRAAAEPLEGGHQRLTFRFDSSGWFYVYHWGVATWLEEHIIPRGLSEEDYFQGDKFPKAVAFSGSSGGSLAAVALATGIPIRPLFEDVLAAHPACSRNPFAMLPAVEKVMNKWVPRHAARSATGRVRVLLTRVSLRPPFLTGVARARFDDWSDVFKTCRASCHVPGIHLCPYRHHGRGYFDGMIWLSLLVPWSGDNLELVVKVSAVSAPLTDIRAPISPLWWIILPPSVDALRGLFWLGYRDAARFFAIPPTSPFEQCRCRNSASMPRRASFQAQDSGDALQRTTSASHADSLFKSRSAKHDLARTLLIRDVPLGPEGVRLPERDPTTGQSVEELIACYRAAVAWSWRMAALLAAATVVAAAALCVVH